MFLNVIFRKIYIISFPALLSHQMEQLLKLKKELSEGQKEVEVMRTDIKDMENNLHQQEIIMKSQPHDKKVVRSLLLI